MGNKFPRGAMSPAGSNASCSKEEVTRREQREKQFMLNSGVSACEERRSMSWIIVQGQSITLMTSGRFANTRGPMYVRRT